MAIRTWNGTGGTLYDWSVAANWEEGSVPVSTDEVVIPAGSSKITGGLNQSAVTLAGLTIEEGYDQAIGSQSGFLRFASSATVSISATGGQQFIDLGSSNISVEVRSTGSAGSGEVGFTLIGSNIATVSVLSGSVGIATALADTATVATVRVLGGSAWLGENVTLTTLYQTGGNADQRCASTTSTIHGGTFETFGSGAIATLNVYGGTAYPASSGTITTLNAYGGRVDFSRSGLARTVTTLTPHATDPLTLIVDPNVITITNFGEPTSPYTLSYN